MNSVDLCTLSISQIPTKSEIPKLFPPGLRVGIKYVHGLQLNIVPNILRIPDINTSSRMMHPLHHICHSHRVICHQGSMQPYPHVWGEGCFHAMDPQQKPRNFEAKSSKTHQKWDIDELRMVNKDILYWFYVSKNSMMKLLRLYSLHDIDICTFLLKESQDSLRHGSLDEWISIKFIFFGSKNKTISTHKKMFVWVLISIRCALRGKDKINQDNEDDCQKVGGDLAIGLQVVWKTALFFPLAKYCLCNWWIVK